MTWYTSERLSTVSRVNWAGLRVKVAVLRFD